MARSSDLTRALDRIAGGAAARLAGPLLTSRRPLPDAPRRIGLIQPTAIGDTLISSGVVEAVHARYPQAALALYHGPGNGAAVRMLDVPLTAVATSFANPIRAKQLLVQGELDLVIDLTPWPNATALCARMAAPVAVGFEPARSGRGRFFDIAVPHRTDRHELDNMAALAAVFGFTGEYRMRIARSAFELPPGLGLDLSRLVLCHLSPGGSRALDKSWPVPAWARLIRHLVDAGFQVGLTGVKADEGLAGHVIAAAGFAPGAADAPISLCGALSLPALAELLARVPLLVTVDTGVLHLAAAVNGRSLALHGPTRPARWGSRAPRATSLEAPHPASGYIDYGYERAPGGARVMETLEPERVIASAMALLEKAELS